MKPTFDVLQTFNQKNIPIHTMYLDQEARKDFNRISHCTNGKCSELQVSSPDAADKLTDTIS